MNMRISSRYRVMLLIGICFLVHSCMMGGSAEQGNAKISGAVSGGSESDSVVAVQLVTEEFDPFNKGSGVVYSTKTDKAGNYRFERVPFGSYYLYVFDGKHDYTLLDGPYTIADEELNLLTTTLQKASVVTIADTTLAGDSLARFFIKGTSAPNATKIDGENTVKIIGVPVGVHDVMKHDSSLEQVSIFTRDVEVLPGDSIMITHQNRQPRIQSASQQLPATVYVDTVCSLVIRASDPDSDQVVYRLITALESYSLDSVTGLFFWTPQQQESGLSRILFMAADPQGAYSVLKWDLDVKNVDSAPAPEVPGGPVECMAESTAVYTTPGLRCLSASSTYRFSFGDGDTSAFSEASSIRHAWIHPGTYEVRVQVRCSDYVQPSAWSLPLDVTVNRSKVTPAPSFKNANDTVYGYDTSYSEPKYGELITDTIFDMFSLNIVPLTCSPAPLYRLYCNGNVLADWTSETGTTFTPDSFGTYEFHAAAWCDTSETSPSEMSEPCTVVVAHSLRPPVIFSSVAYLSPDSTEVKLTLESDTQSNGSAVSYRLSVGFKELGYENRSAVIGSVKIDTCTNGQSCQVSVMLYNFEPTRWFTEKTALIGISKSYGTCLVQAQAVAKGRIESSWSEVISVEPK